MLLICNFQFKSELLFSFQSIREAHFNMKPAELYYSETELHDANINRSPYGYDANPQEERDK